MSWKELGQENEAQEEGLEEAGGSASWESQETEATGDPPTVQIQVEAKGKLLEREKGREGEKVGEKKEEGKV